LKPEPINVGDFVYCRSRRYRDQLQLPAELGLVIEIKRSNFKVVYANDKRAWLPREFIVRMDPEPGSPSLLNRVHYLLKRVQAHECELVLGDHSNRVAARIDRIDQVAVDEIRSFLGPNFESLTVVPEGMAFMTVEIAFH
jgi:hypothetical protein